MAEQAGRNKKGNLITRMSFLKKSKLEFFKMTDKGLLLTKILELYPVKAEYVRAILDSHKIDEDGSIKATELLEFFKTLYVDDALRNDDTININKLRSEVEAFELQIKNNDNRIKISDLALLLPQKERLFLKFISFCRKQITSVEFFELLLKYATDKSGKISQDQLYKMVKDFADEIGAPEDHCNDCVRYILALFNADDDSTLDMFEFPRLFNIEGNFLKKLKPHGRFSAVDFDNIIKHYDRDANGTIDAGGELMALIADVLEYADIRVNGELLFEMVDAALDLCEKTNLQKLGSEDLKVILTQLPKQRMG
ncbi:hypothetical protein ACHWQZ_G017257 [Mnemiopsis leidyi]